MKGINFWNFWNKQEELPVKKPISQIEPIEPKASFLFATGDNDCSVLSVKRHYFITNEEKTYVTNVIFNKKNTDVGYKRDSTEISYGISYEQHEDFIKQLKERIECIVV